MTIIRMYQMRGVVTAALAVLVCFALLVIQPRSTASVPSQQFQGYTIELPAGTRVALEPTKGQYGEVRTTYHTPAGERLMTIVFSADFGWSEFSEELTYRCPSAIEGPQQPINWAGSLKGGYTGWHMGDCDLPSELVTFVTFSEDDSAVAVVYYGSATPPSWLVSAIERAQWTE